MHAILLAMRFLTDSLLRDSTGVHRVPFRFDWIVLIILLALPVSAVPHGDKPHGSAAPENQPASAQQAPAPAIETDSASTGSADSPAPPASAANPGETAEVISMSIGTVLADLTLSDFPTLHPMVVHIPVTFIPVALLFSVFSLFYRRRELIWLTLGFASAGLLGGLVAAFPLHPHTAGLSAAAQLTLQKHDFFAYTTIWLALASVALAAAVFNHCRRHYGSLWWKTRLCAWRWRSGAISFRSLSSLRQRP